MSRALQGVSKAGFGQPGYCKLCASDMLPAINDMIKRGKNAAEVQRWAKEFNLEFARQTFYTHRDHITDPKTTFVERARANPVIKRVSSREFLEAIKDAGAAQAAADPSSISIDHALKATQILMQDRKAHDGITLILVDASTGNLSRQLGDVIEGQYKELPSEQPDGVAESPKLISADA